MPMPDTQDIRKPLLEVFRGEAPRNFVISEILELIAEYFSINLNDISSGDKNILRSRINEAKSDLKKNGYIYNPSGNTYMITNAGTKILEDDPEIITDEYLKAHKKKHKIDSQPEIMPVKEPDALPEIVAEEADTEPEIMPVSEPDALPEIVAEEAETESEIPPIDEPDTVPEIVAEEAETESEIPPIDEPDTVPEIVAEEADTVPEILPIDEPDALPEIVTEEADTESEIPPVNEPDALPEIVTEEAETESEIPPIDEPDTVPEIVAEEADTESEILPIDEPDTVPEIVTEEADTEPELSPEVVTPETETENTPDITLDDEPEEILDTEEVHNDTMPEETLEGLTPETLHEDEEYDPSIVAEAMSSGGIDDAVARHNSELADQLLMRTAGLPQDRFEMFVIDLLSKMGYFAFQTARYTTESAGSDLIHGVILDNKTGANIYIQARKLSPGRTVGKADIQEFVDELSDKGGKGIFATTANFSENAKILAADERLMLIDGEKLANLMIANNFCVNVEKVYEIKVIDSESFSEYE